MKTGSAGRWLRARTRALAVVGVATIAAAGAAPPTVGLVIETSKGAPMDHGLPTAAMQSPVVTLSEQGRTTGVPGEESVPALAMSSDTESPTRTEEWITFYGDLDGSWGSYVMRPDGSGLRKVPGKGEEQIDPEWSPDGSRLLIADGDELVVTSVDGAYRQVLPVGGAGKRFKWAAWSPDGSQIVATMCPGRDYCAGQIWLIDLGTGTSRYVTDGQGPSWHPDGRHVVFVHVSNLPSCRKPLVVAEIQVRPGSGYCHGDLMRLDTLTESVEPLGQWGHFPRYSPDGRRLLWERYSGEKNLVDVVVAPVDDLRSWRSLTGEGHDLFPSWSPDGTRILFNRISPLNLGSTIWIMNADGSAQRALQGITGTLFWHLIPKLANRAAA